MAGRSGVEQIDERYKLDMSLSSHVLAVSAKYSPAVIQSPQAPFNHYALCSGIDVYLGSWTTARGSGIAVYLGSETPIRGSGIVVYLGSRTSIRGSGIAVYLGSRTTIHGGGRAYT